MAYCTEADVLREFKSLVISSDTSIKTADVAAWIAEADAEIDARVGLIYATPVTGTNSLLVVRSMSVGLVAGKIREVLRVKSGLKQTEQDNSTDSAKVARTKLDKIVKREMKLSDASLVDNDQGLQSYNSGLSTDERVFKKGIAQW